MSWSRTERLEALLKEKIATVVLERLSDPRIGFTTITRVELSRDRKYAAVFYTVLGEPSQVRKTARALTQAAPHIQETIGPSLKIRHVPQLRFVFDERVERERSMRELLDKLGTEGAEHDDVSLAEAEGEVEGEVEAKVEREHDERDEGDEGDGVPPVI